MELAKLAPMFNVASAGFTALGGLREADSYRQVGELQAQQYEQNANTVIGISQRKAAEQRRQTKLVQSRLQATAAASGAGATDPTVATLAGGIAEEGELRALNELYEGREQARGLRMQGEVAKFEGESYAQATRTKAMTSLGSSAFSLFEKYADPSDKAKMYESIPDDMIKPLEPIGSMKYPKRLSRR